MAIFGYLVWVVICGMLTISTLALVVVAKAFDDTKGMGWAILFLFIIDILAWYVAYLCFPFQVTLK